MYQVVFSQPGKIGFSKSAGGRQIEFQPGVPYVVTTSQYMYLKDNKTPLWQEAYLESRLRNFVANAHGGRGSLLFHTGAGGYGDQLLALPVAKYLHDLGYSVTALIDPGNDQCWEGHDWLKGTLGIPCEKGAFQGFDHHAMAAVVTNLDEFPDQRHPVDAMLYRFGVEPDTVPSAKKIVAPVIRDAEAQTAACFVADRRIALYQMGGSGHARRLTATASRQLFMALADSIPELFWVGLFDRHFPPEYFAPLPVDAPKNCQLISFPGLRQLFAVAARAEVGVGPDSLLVHLMGSLGRPMVGLWGPTPPKLRVAYYPKHVPIWKQGSCPHAPCLRFRPTLEKCPPSARQADACLCLRDIDPEEVVTATRLAMAQ